ncbi:hypothetical protein MANI_026987 [Metarhizium anisopliae]|nr:hypothetical protein MANI_026987 [Metarhizium anisopliae]
MKPYACFTVALLGASVSAEQEAWSVTTIYHTVTTYLPYEQHRCSALFLPKPGNSQLPEAACRPGACCVQVVKENDYIQELVPTEGIGKTAPTGSPTTPKTTALTETKTLSQTPHKSSHGDWVPTQPPISYTENTTPKTTYSTTTETTETFPRLDTHVSSISTNGLRIHDIPALSSQHVSSRQGSGVAASPSTQQSTPSLTENSKGASSSKERGNVSNATISSKSALPMKPSSTRACQSSFGSSSSSPRSHSSMSSRKPASSQLVSPSRRPSTSVAASSTKASSPGLETDRFTKPCITKAGILILRAREQAVFQRGTDHFLRIFYDFLRAARVKPRFKACNFSEAGEQPTVFKHAAFQLIIAADRLTKADLLNTVCELPEAEFFKPN